MTLRLSWPRRRRNTPETAPESVPTAPEPPVWLHVPTPPVQCAERCGQCGERIPERALSLEFCSAVCQARWITAFTAWLDAEAKWRRGELEPLHTCEPPPAKPRLVPELPPEPSWLAAFSAADKAKADQVIAERKSTGSEQAA